MLWMIYDAVDLALKPYEAAFYEWGGLLTVAFIAGLLGVALDDRLHRIESQGEDQAR